MTISITFSELEILIRALEFYIDEVSDENTKMIKEKKLLREIANCAAQS